MNVAPEHREDFEALPAALRQLLTAELAAGNEIVEVAHCHPAPPAGAYFRLARPVSTRPRASGQGLVFFDRNSSLYSGEFTDARRFYFILEPPNPPRPEPDMNAIHAARAKQQGTSNTRSGQAQETSQSRRATPCASGTESLAHGLQTTVDRFRESMEMNFERWHDGIGYDLSLIQAATPAELIEIENLLVARGVNDWRDVEALAMLDSQRARSLLLRTMKSGQPDLAVAVAANAPHLATEAERAAVLVAALQYAEAYGGLTQTLLEVETFHPPPVVEALLRGVLARRGEDAMHFAAMLLFIHGQAESAFDWNQRPFLLEFNTPDRARREKMFRDLCAKIRVAPEKYLQGG